MNPFSFVADIAGGFNRSKALEDFIGSRKEMRETTLKMLEDFQLLVGNKGYARGIEAWGKPYAKAVPSSRGKKFTQHILDVLKANDALSGDIEDQFEKHVPKDASADALDYRGATLIQYGQLYSFVNRYTRKLLLHFLDIMHAEAPNKGIPFKAALLSPELKWLNANVGNYFAAIESMAKVAANLDKGLKEIPDVTVSLSDYEVQRAVSGDNKIDPFNMGFFSARWNPIYHIRMAIADYVIARYEAAKEERQALEYRIMALQEANDGSNPRLEQEIKYHTDRLNSINAKIAKVEESVHERA